MKSIAAVILLSALLLSCHENKRTSAHSPEKAFIVDVQPFNSFPPDRANIVLNELKKIFPNVKLLPARPLPSSLFYAPRNRYRADTLIAWLGRRTADNHVTIGLTDKDISTTKGDIADYGIMGLGFCPGRSCIASSFRLSKANMNEQLFKVAIHELGHTEGLPHCEEKECFMRDAEGHNPTDDEKGFCPKCKAFLQSKGWQFNS